jgi:hypothetical protein
MNLLGVTKAFSLIKYLFECRNDLSIEFDVISIDMPMSSSEKKHDKRSQERKLISG